MESTARDTQLDGIDYNPLSEFAQEEFDAMKEDIQSTGKCNIGGIIGCINYTVRDVIEECEDDELTGLLNDAIASVFLGSNPVSMEMQAVIKDIQSIVEEMVKKGLKAKVIENLGEYA